MASVHFFDCHVCPNNHFFLPATEACDVCGRPPSQIICRFCHKPIATEKYAAHISSEKGELSFCYVSKMCFNSKLFYTKSKCEYDGFLEPDRRKAVVPILTKLLNSKDLAPVDLPELSYGKIYCFKLRSTVENEESKIFTMRLAVGDQFLGFRVTEEIAKYDTPTEPFKSVHDVASRLSLTFSSSDPRPYSTCYVEGKAKIPVVSELYPSCITIIAEDGIYYIYTEYCTKETFGPSLYSLMQRHGHAHYYELFQSFYLNSVDSLRWFKSRTWILDDIYQPLRKLIMKEIGHSDPWFDSSLFTTITEAFEDASAEVPTNWKGLKVKVKEPSEDECSEIAHSQCCLAEARVCMTLSAEARKIYNYASEDKHVMVHEVCKVSQLDIRKCTKCEKLESQDLESAATAISSAITAVPVGLKMTADTLLELCSTAQSEEISQFILPSLGSTFLQPNTYKRMITDQRFTPIVHKSPVNPSTSNKQL